LLVPVTADGLVVEGMRRAMDSDTRGGVRLLSQSRGEATTVERDRLQLAARALVVRTTRLRFQDDRPLMYEMVCLAVGRVPGVESEHVGNYDLLELAGSHGLDLGPTNERATVTEAEAEEARLLGIPRRMPVLRLDRIICSAEGLPVEWRVGICHLPASALSEQRKPAGADC
jgi:GntR family transcriptional regulator